MRSCGGRTATEQKKIEKNTDRMLPDEKVQTDHHKADALKAKQKSTGLSNNLCAIVNKFWPKLKDISNNFTGTLPKSLKKGGVENNSSSPAKKTRTEETHPVSAEHNTYQTIPNQTKPVHQTRPPAGGAGQNSSAKMLQKKGSHSESKKSF